MYLVVAGLGIPAAFRNVTALAMVIAWLSVELVYQITGDSLPLQYSFMADIAVVAVIYAKTNGRNECAAGRTQLRRLITDLTICDRLIVGIYFALVWPAYVLQFDPYTKWMLLWALAIAQFALAGGEALATTIARRKAKPETPIIDRHLVVVPFPAQRSATNLQRRVADAAFEPPVNSDSPSVLLVAYEGKGYG